MKMKRVIFVFVKRGANLQAIGWSRHDIRPMTELS